VNACACDKSPPRGMSSACSIITEGGITVPAFEGDERVGRANSSRHLISIMWLDAAAPAELTRRCRVSRNQTNAGAAPSHGVPSTASSTVSTVKPPSGRPPRSGEREEAMASRG